MKKRKIIKGQELKKVQKIKSSPDGHLNLIGVKIEFYALFYYLLLSSYKTGICYSKVFNFDNTKIKSSFFCQFSPIEQIFQIKFFVIMKSKKKTRSSIIQTMYTNKKK